MSYERLYTDHLEIDRLAQTLIRLVSTARPDPVEAVRRLEQIAGLVRDHIAHEDPIIYATLDATRHDRHGQTAAICAEDFELLKEDWAQYLYRWDAPHVAANWAGFARETRAMFGRLRDRVTWETSVLYALAVHHGIMPTE